MNSLFNYHILKAHPSAIVTNNSPDPTVAGSIGAAIINARLYCWKDVWVNDVVEDLTGLGDIIELLPVRNILNPKNFKDRLNFHGNGHTLLRIGGEINPDTNQDLGSFYTGITFINQPANLVQANMYQESFHPTYMIILYGVEFKDSTIYISGGLTREGQSSFDLAESFTNCIINQDKPGYVSGKYSQCIFNNILGNLYLNYGGINLYEDCLFYSPKTLLRTGLGEQTGLHSSTIITDVDKKTAIFQSTSSGTGFENCTFIGPMTGSLGTGSTKIRNCTFYNNSGSDIIFTCGNPCTSIYTLHKVIHPDTGEEVEIAEITGYTNYQCQLYNNIFINYTFCNSRDTQYIINQNALWLRLHPDAIPVFSGVGQENYPYYDLCHDNYVISNTNINEDYTINRVDYSALPETQFKYCGTFNQLKEEDLLLNSEDQYHQYFPNLNPALAKLIGRDVLTSASDNPTKDILGQDRKEESWVGSYEG